jgi:hypothetical protein
MDKKALGALIKQARDSRTQADLAATVRAFLLSYRDNLASADPVAKRKTIETFVEKVIVFAARFDCHFRVDPVSDKVGGGEPCLLLSLTIPRQVMPTRKKAPVETGA